MPPLAPSIFSLMAAGLYIGVALSASVALSGAVMTRQLRWHVLSWAAVAALFVVLSLSRVLTWEEWLREELRLALRLEGTYVERRELQAPIVAVLFSITVALAVFWGSRLGRSVRGRRNAVTLVSLGCTGGLMFLVLLRIVSLHLIDELLYGPLKLNWIIDLGLSVGVLICGAFYFRIVTGRAPAH